MEAEDVTAVQPNPKFNTMCFNCKEVARHYIVTVLRENGYTRLANQFPPVRDPDQNMHRLINDVCRRVEMEKSQQFDEIISSLTITEDSLDNIYRQLTTLIFQDGVNWGTIVTILVISSRLSLYCAQCGMQNRVWDIVEWTTDEVCDRVHTGWDMQIRDWEHSSYYEDEWKVSTSSFLVATIATLVMMASGLFLVRRFLF
jgi:hypothetical protein